MPSATSLPDATGRLVRALPPGPERDELLGLVRIGVRFKSQHVGRRPGALATLVAEIVGTMKDKPTFRNLLHELELAAARRSLYGPAHPIEKVDRIWQVLTYHEGGERKQTTFDRVRNILTDAKKQKFPPAAKP